VITTEEHRVMTTTIGEAKTRKDNIILTAGGVQMIKVTKVFLLRLEIVTAIVNSSKINYM